jgi:hypothetical protein
VPSVVNWYIGQERDDRPLASLIALSGPLSADATDEELDQMAEEMAAEIDAFFEEEDGKKGN